MKYTLIFLSIFCIAAYAQPSIDLPLLSETNIIPGDSSYTVYYSYRIHSNNMVFVKDGKDYSANYRITIEITDSSFATVTRQIEEKKIYADTFDETISENTFDEDLFSFNLKKGKYILTPVIADLNSQHEYKLNPEKLTVGERDQSKFLTPVILNSTSQTNNLEYRLTNYAGDIPFSEDAYDILIPCTDTSSQSIYAMIVCEKDTVFNGILTHPFKAHLYFHKENGSITVSGRPGSAATMNYMLSGVSRKLPEGSFEIILSMTSKPSPAEKLEKAVRWFNEPMSLRNPEYSIKYLEIIERPEKISELLKGDSDNYRMNLFNYWKKLDPTPNTQFNPLMAEYYERVDYSMRHFYTLSRKRGITITDRSKIYIKYGKPAEVKRSYNQHGQSIETWIYKKPERLFNFIDKTGMGNFILMANDK